MESRDEPRVLTLSGKQVTDPDGEEPTVQGDQENVGNQEPGGYSPLGSDFMLGDILEDCLPTERVAMPVLNAKSIMEIVEKKEISIKTPRSSNQQHLGLDDSLFDFGDALVDYTSDGGSIRINQGLATLMLIAATSEASSK